MKTRNNQQYVCSEELRKEYDKVREVKISHRGAGVEHGLTKRFQNKPDAPDIVTVQGIRYQKQKDGRYKRL